MLIRITAVICFFTTLAWSNVSVLPIFSDNMVIQRNTDIVIWGRATPGESVKVSASWGKVANTVTGSDGKWSLKLPTPKAGGPFEIIISGKNTITLKNVLSGEVWLCTGQSNMDCTMGFFKDTKNDIENANSPTIRMLTVRKKIWPKGPNEFMEGKWQLCTPATVRNFSATGYYFGLNINKELNVPVGLIKSSWGGTRIEAWTPWESQDHNPRLIKYRADMVKAALEYDLQADREKYKSDKQKWDEWRNNGKKGPKPNYPRMMHPLDNNCQFPATLYNGMINPIAPYTIKGAIWYQGESNAQYANEYDSQLEILINSWRKRWGQGDFPFYFVQLPNFYSPWKTPVEYNSAWAILREAFAKVADKVPNTAMAITIDIGEAKDIHPQQKSKVGNRLARLALHKDYGKKDIVWSGPYMKSVEFKDGKAVVKFETGGADLAVRDGNDLYGFALVGENGIALPAKAKIIGADTIEVFSNSVKKPLLVYYAWANNPEGSNLINKGGMPASPFRFGKMPKIDLSAKFIPEINAGYKLVYACDPLRTKASDTYKYTTDNSDKIKNPFTRVAYFLALVRSTGTNEYIFVEMDAFTEDIKKIGIPVKSTGAIFQQMVKNITIKSNVKNVKTGDFADGFNIEFWHCNYKAGNIKNIPDASDKYYDFGDEMDKKDFVGYGSMQIHNYKDRAPVMCYNNFRMGSSADIGIGKNKYGQPDWTFSKSGQRFVKAELKVFVK